MDAQRSVKEEFPNAVVDDDGSWVYIRDGKVVTEQCPHCRQDWTHTVINFEQTLGSGNCEAAAWEDAAQRLKQQ